MNDKHETDSNPLSAAILDTPVDVESQVQLSISEDELWCEFRYRPRPKLPMYATRVICSKVGGHLYIPEENERWFITTDCPPIMINSIVYAAGVSPEKSAAVDIWAGKEYRIVVEENCIANIHVVFTETWP
jgi:hypothetical protein